MNLDTDSDGYLACTAYVANAGTGAAWSLQLVPEGGGEATVVDAGSPLYWCWTTLHSHG